MSNYSFSVRIKRWAKFLVNAIIEKAHGLDFSMVYVGDIQRSTDEFHGYSMTDAQDMKHILQSIPVERDQSAFLDVGCGKGMCMKCAVELGYRKVAGLDLDEHLLEIARNNMHRLRLDAECIHVNAAEFDGYKDYDVFYFYNPFSEPVFCRVIQLIQESQRQRPRDIWIAYYHPVYGQLFENNGFILKKELRDSTRDTVTRFYHLPSE